MAKIKFHFDHPFKLENGMLNFVGFSLIFGEWAFAIYLLGFGFGISAE